MLFAHQERAVDFALHRGGTCALFMDLGTGKTLTVLELYRRVRDQHTKLVVFCPLSLIEAAWGADIKRFTNFTYQNLHDDGFPAPNAVPDILIMNYEMLLSAKNVQALERLAAVYPMMAACDESSKMKNHTAKTTKTLLKLRDKFRYRIIMSGTPAPNSPLEYFAQMNFLEPHLLGTSFHGFKNTYFHLERNGQIANLQGQIANLQGQMMTREAMAKIYGQGYEWKITESNRRRLMERIAPSCFVVKKQDCLDLPEAVDTVREVPMGARQRSAYNEMKRHLVAEIQGEFITSQNALTKLMKLRELTSGFAMTGDRVVEVGENPKLTELMQVAEEAGDQMIVWGNFLHEINTISKALAKVGSVSTLYSLTEDKNASIEAFRNGETRFLVAHPRSAAHGLTFVNCNTQVFFSLDYSAESYEQARGRTHRAGQTRKCTYVHLVAKDSIDQDIMDVLQRKITEQDILQRMIPRRVAA